MLPSPGKSVVVAKGLLLTKSDAQLVMISNCANLVECLILHSRVSARGGLKENGQNPDSGSKNSENQNNDAVL